MTSTVRIVASAKTTLAALPLSRNSACSSDPPTSSSSEGRRPFEARTPTRPLQFNGPWQLGTLGRFLRSQSRQQLALSVVSDTTPVAHGPLPRPNRCWQSCPCLGTAPANRTHRPRQLGNGARLFEARMGRLSRLQLNALEHPVARSSELWFGLNARYGANNSHSLSSRILRQSLAEPT
jgi:hypothetical protein